MGLSEKRLGRVTASAAGAILGVAPYKSAEDVLRSMVRSYHGAESEFEGNIATRYGQMNEPVAVLQYMTESGLTVEPADFAIHPEHDWLGASPDGIVGARGLIEVKCPYGLRDDADPQFKPLSAQPHYYAQVQIQLACTGRNWCDFVQWNSHAITIERVFPDAEYMDSILPDLYAFHQLYMSELDNADHLKPRRRELTTLKAIALVREYKDARTAEQEAAERAKALLAEIVTLADGKDSDIAGHKLTKVQKEGAVSYAKAVKDLLPDADLEKYRGKPSEYWVLN